MSCAASEWPDRAWQAPPASVVGRPDPEAGTETGGREAGDEREMAKCPLLLWLRKPHTVAERPDPTNTTSDPNVAPLPRYGGVRRS
jgi:hypothetical protein